MIELEKIRTDIAALKSIEAPADIHAAIEDIFFDLIYADQPFYVAFLKGAPCASPFKSDPKRLFLRLFSHKGVAERYRSRNEEMEIVSLSLEETMQLAKTMFLRGVYGYLLNEGDKWIQISLPNYLHLFFSRVIHADNSYNESCVQVISFLNELRRNSVYRYGAVCPAAGGEETAGEWSGPDGVCLIQPDAVALPDVDYIAKPISVQSLYHIPKDTVRIITLEEPFEVSTLLLRGGLDYCGFREDKDSEPFVSDYFDEPVPIAAEEQDWHTNDLSLAFEPAVPPTPEDIPENSPEPDEEQHEGKLTISLPSFLTTILSKGKTILRKGEAEEEAIGEEQGEEEEPETVTEEPLREEEVEEKAAKRNKWRFVLIAGLCVLLVGCIAGVFAIRHHQRQERLEQFCSYIDTREYGNAYTVYNESGLGADANNYLTEHLDRLVIKYANNELSAEELSASMQSLANFPSLEQNLEIAKLTAAKLEASKNAYVQGKECEDVFGKLDLWRQVVDLDSVNYAAVQKAVKENRDDYVEELNSQITRYSTLLRDFAKARYEVLAYWYPDSEPAANWSGYYQEDGRAQLTFFPISISSLKIEQQPDRYWSLYIDWKNTSVKTIQEVCFVVVALDESGNYVTNQDSIGTWTIFEARDSSAYTPGEGAPSSDYKWSHVFYGSSIASVQLTAVNITYADGSTSSYTTDADLAAIFP